ncbi:M15 family metallopeptidase [Brevibacillus sp. TJ4]|uniref:M15 family metallopeptidase n=1 Tax=Brevibacillus sp. TJ4 TaxID=3234853 RepID=UPI0037D04386
MNKKRVGLMIATTACLAVILSSCSQVQDGAGNGGEEQTPPAVSPADEQDQPTDGAIDDIAPEPTAKLTLEETIQDVNGVPTVTNPDDLIVIVNKQRSLPVDYRPADLVEPNVDFPFDEKVEKRLMRAEAARALEALFLKAEMDGVKLYAVSGFRSYKTQKSLYESYVQKQGAEHAAAFSAVPGKSEHQTGLAMDVSGADSVTRLEQSFADTPEGKWLEENCAKFGFVIRYPEGKEDITGYAYEPWHLRYVGTQIAEEVMEKGITLEEYFSGSGI